MNDRTTARALLRTVGARVVTWFKRNPPAVVPARATHEVIVSDDGTCAVWPSGLAVPADWRHMGKSGGEAELLAYLLQERIETSPAPLWMSSERWPREPTER